MKLLKALAVTIGCTLGLGGIGEAVHAQEQQSTLDKIRERGHLLAGVRYDYPPNGYMDAQGQVRGYGPDVARAFARRLGVEVRFVQETAQTRIPLLESGQVDASFGPTTPSKSRDEVVDFSLTYNIEGVVVVVRKGDSVEPADYYNAGKKIGAVQGAIFIDLWKEKDPETNFTLFQEYPPLLVALMNGQVDAALLNEVQARDMVTKIGDGELVVGSPFFKDPHAIMMRENDSKWRDWVNWALQRMYHEGSLGKIYQENYGAEFTLDIWQNGILQPGVLSVSDKVDVWVE